MVNLIYSNPERRLQRTHCVAAARVALPWRMCALRDKRRSQTRQQRDVACDRSHRAMPGACILIFVFNRHMEEAL